MDIQLSIRRTTVDGKVVCFKHAVIRAIEGEIITEEVDEFNKSDCDFRSTSCYDCGLITSKEIITIDSKIITHPSAAIAKAKEELDKRKLPEGLAPSNYFDDPFSREAWEADKNAGRLDD